jgi:hypothetical protein
MIKPLTDMPRRGARVPLAELEQAKAWVAGDAG